MANTGTLQVQTLKGNSYVPVTNSKVTITPSAGNARALRQTSNNLTTDSSGKTPAVSLEAPPLAYSMKPSSNIPYSMYDIKVEAEGYAPVIVKNCQVYPQRLAIQQCRLKTASARQTDEEIINILPNRLVGNYPPKIPENPNKPEPKTPSGLVVLPQPVIPEYVVVHAGVPDDTTAANYTVFYKDYIKNVASSEIFSTWPSTTIQANIFCIISFTLNRIYTEWYRGKGKDFDITNSTAYDHAFVYGRNFYDNISQIVDSIFSTYVKRPGKKQPLLTQYCDGTQVQCPGWLTQWGSKYLGDEGYNPTQILTNFYGTDLVFDTANKVSGIPMSYPGYILGLGSTGQPVRTVQTFLNRISDNYPAIPKVAVSGTYDMNTRKAVLEFQKDFYLPQTGTVDYATWYKISDVYVAVTKIAELRGSSTFVPPVPHIKSIYEVPTVNYPTD